jgi:hypothetical protein
VGGFFRLALFDFTTDVNMDRWAVMNDGVMGGLSKGKLEVTAEGHGRFSGTVSLENYGGFTSIRCAVADIATTLKAVEFSFVSKETVRITNSA